MADFRKEFAKRLRFTREMREMTQAELGKRAELDQTHIAHFEAASRLPGAENLKALAKGLMVSSDYLLGLSERVQ
jgi:transcriptional regulator with XRE-family HTH domain